MAFQGFNNFPGPTTPPKFNIRFGVRNTPSPPPSTSASLVEPCLLQSPPSQSLLSSSSSPIPKHHNQSPAFSFGVGSGDASLLSGDVSKDLPAEDRKQKLSD